MQYEGGYYRESGKAPIKGIFITLLIGLGTAAICVPIYAYVIHWNPFVYINFLATLVVGLGIGLGIHIGSSVGNLRNGFVRLFLGLITIAFALYFLWFFKMGITTKQWLLFKPIELWNTINEVNVVGTWGVKDVIFKGGGLWAVWIIETIVIVWIALWMTFRAGKEIFCEQCSKWLEAETYFPLSPVLMSRKEFRNTLERADFTCLEELDPITEITDAATKISLTCCHDCDSMSYVSVEFQQYKAVKDKVDTKEKMAVENLAINADRAQSLREKWSAVLTTSTQ